MVEFLGNLHPAAVHFPVALVVVAAAAELAAARRNDPVLGEMGRFTLSIGAVFAVVSVLLGFMASSGRVFSPELKPSIDAHRVFGIVSAGLVVLAAALAWGSRVAGAMERSAREPDTRLARDGESGDSARRAIYRIVLVLALVAVLAAGYFGAEVTHGPGHLLSK